MLPWCEFIGTDFKTRMILFEWLQRRRTAQVGETDQVESGSRLVRIEATDMATRLWYDGCGRGV